MWRLLKRDGSVAYGFHNPDGSWVEMPAPNGDAPNVRPPEEPGQVVAPPIPASTAPEQVRRYMREMGSKGGQARASRHSREQIAAWGRARHKKQPS